MCANLVSNMCLTNLSTRSNNGFKPQPMLIRCTIKPLFISLNFLELRSLHRLRLHNYFGHLSSSLKRLDLHINCKLTSLLCSFVKLSLMRVYSCTLLVFSSLAFAFPCRSTPSHSSPLRHRPSCQRLAWNCNLSRDDEQL